jgi:hypothetical protein
MKKNPGKTTLIVLLSVTVFTMFWLVLSCSTVKINSDEQKQTETITNVAKDQNITIDHGGQNQNISPVKEENTGAVRTAKETDFDWYIYTDKNDGGSSTIKQTTNTLAGKLDVVHTFTGKVTTRYRYGYAGVIISPLNEQVLSALKTAKGIKFMFSGDGKKYRFIVDAENITDGNTFSKEIFAAEAPKEITINYDELRQEDGWGKQVEFNRNLIKELKIQTLGQPIDSFRFEIRGIEIF